MAIKAVFLSGKKDATTESLYQWDYGQELEIEFKDLGSLICEVHFACNGMSEAIVRPCTLSAGIGGVTIPNECLEQPSAITAWIYEKGVDISHGRTRGVITIPIVARMRPGVVRDIPPEINDQYALLIAKVNDAINNIEDGVVKAKYAAEADTAKEATHAGNASTANYAMNAGEATRATDADKATSLSPALLEPEVLEFPNVLYKINAPGLYLVATMLEGGEVVTSLLYVPSIGQVSHGSSAVVDYNASTAVHVLVWCDKNGELHAGKGSGETTYENLGIFCVYKLAGIANPYPYPYE